MPSIIEGFRKIYKAPNALRVHLLLAGLIVFMTAVNFLMYTSGSLIVKFFAAILLIIYGIYVYGYKFRFMHNVFQEEFLMPEIDAGPFKAVGNAFALLLVWGLYLAVYAIVTSILTAVIIPIAIMAKIPIALTLAFGIVMIALMYLVFFFTPYIFVAYSKDFNTTGLYNMLLPFKFVRKSFLDNLILWLKWIPLAIVFALMLVAVWKQAGILEGLIQSIHGTLAAKPNLQVIYTPKLMVLQAVLAYMAFVFSFVYSNYIVQIYKAKREQ